MADRPQTVEEVRKLVDKMGIEFVFAQFVEMYGKPNAKLVPASHVEDLFAEGAGFAGFATGEIGQGPHNPDLAANRRSEERRVGQECEVPCRSRWSPYH